LSSYIARSLRVSSACALSPPSKPTIPALNWNAPTAQRGSWTAQNERIRSTTAAAC
jgi:hypothetical protein